MKFTLTFARTLIMKTIIEAENEDEAWEIAGEMENEGELGLDTDDLEHWFPKDGCWIDEIVDDATVWEMEQWDTDSCTP